MKPFEVEYDDPETGERVTTKMWFDDTPTVSAKEWAEDYAYAKADKGWHHVRELPSNV